jgi:hypothetical protein
MSEMLASCLRFFACGQRLKSGTPIRYHLNFVVYARHGRELVPLDPIRAEFLKLAFLQETSGLDLEYMTTLRPLSGKIFSS